MQKRMDRRNFFRSAISKSGKTVVKAVDSRINKQASRWIRPPFAINELEFLLTCSRCNACIDACPYHVIFSLPARIGTKFAATPALDLINHGCHLCEGWPCVTVCEVKALAFPLPATDDSDLQTDDLQTDNLQIDNLPANDLRTDALRTEDNTPETAAGTNHAIDEDITETRLLPELARIRINEQSCLPYSGPECGACFDSCPVTGALTQDGFRPVINPSLCCGCGLCRESCIVDPKAITISSVQRG